MASKTAKPGSAANKTARGPMAVNKSATPVWMKTVIIMMIVAFVGGGIGVAFIGANAGKSGNGAATTTITAGDEAGFQAKVTSAQSVLATNPNDPEAMARVGHAYYEWAVSVYESQQLAASVPIWQQAVAFYDQSLAIRPDNDIVLGNKAFALYYAAAAGATAEFELAPAALEAFIESASDNASLSAEVENARNLLDDLEAAASSQTTTTP